MPKLTCDCGAEHFFTINDLRAAAATPFKCPKCGKVRKLPLLPPALPEQPADQPEEDIDVGNLFAEIEALDLSVPPPVPLSPLAAAVQQELDEEGGMMFLEFWAIIVVLACYLLAAAGIIVGILVYRRADSVMQEIFALLCWLGALIGLCGGSSIQVLLEICRQVKNKSD
jgi:hypothetical protein